jgi:hypothetical protein
MSSGFDPCKQWLGIDALSLGDPWLVLGVTRGETNPLAIVRAADTKLAILRSVPAGPLSIARDALVKRVEAARDELLASATQAPIAPPTPAAPPPRPTYAPPPVPMAPPVPQMPVPSEQSPAIRLSKRPVVTQSSAGPAIVAVFSLLAVVVAAYLAYQVLERRKQETRRKPDQVAVVPQPASTGKDRQADGQTETKQNTSSDPGDATDSAGDVSMPVKGKRPAESVGEVTPKDPPPTEPPTASPTRGRKPQDNAQPDNAQPTDEPNSELRSEPNSEPGAKPKPKPDAAAPDEDPEMRSKPKPGSRPDSEPDPDAGPSTPKPTAVPESEDADAATAVTKLLREAYAALVANEFDTAKAALKTAVSKAGGDDALSLRVNCFRQLAQYAEQFIGYRDEAFKAAADGGIYELPGGKMLSIVEINDEELVYKAGINKRIPRDEIPPAWTQTIITKWFSGADKPGNHVFLGVYHVLKEKPDLEGAENEWRLAEFGGENVSFLTPLLRDPVIVANVKDAN